MSQPLDKDMVRLMAKMDYLKEQFESIQVDANKAAASMHKFNGVVTASQISVKPFRPKWKVSMVCGGCNKEPHGNSLCWWNTLWLWMKRTL